MLRAYSSILRVNFKAYYLWYCVFTKVLPLKPEEAGLLPSLLGKRENGRLLFLLRSYLPAYDEGRFVEKADFAAGA